jgi:hypothetical protein
MKGRSFMNEAKMVAPETIGQKLEAILSMADNCVCWSEGIRTALYGPFPEEVEKVNTREPSAEVFIDEIEKRVRKTLDTLKCIKERL